MSDRRTECREALVEARRVIADSQNELADKSDTQALAANLRRLEELLVVVQV
jgi:hypothetical protein